MSIETTVTTPPVTLVTPSTTSKCPWKKQEAVVTSPSFRELMDCDLAEKLQKEEDERYNHQLSLSLKETKTDTSNSEEYLENIGSEENDADNDYLLALMLQQEYTDEFNGMMKRYESAVNRNSKLKVSMKNFMLLPASQQNEPEPGSVDLEDLDREALSDYEQDVHVPSFNRRGTSGKGDTIVTKHNATICGKRNVARVMNTFPPEFDTGNVLNDTRLSNRVFNQLKLHSYAEEKRMNRSHDKDETSTSSLALDRRTRITLLKAVNAQILDSLGSIIATGKESVVLYGVGGTNEQHPMSSEVAIKIFKTTLNEYRTREKYLREDFRFKNRYKSLNPRKIVKLWAEKEMFNLQRLRRVGILCPEPLLLKKHILFLSFIGKESVPALRLRDAILTDDELSSAYQQCLKILQQIYQECKLIHADFSEYNLLWFDGKVYVIDVAQAVEPYHPNAYIYLLRDCTNVSVYFTRKSLNKQILSPEQTFNYVTGLGFNESGEEFLNQVQAYQKNIRLPSEAVKENDEFSFEHFFNQAKQSQNIDSSSSDSDVVEDDGDEDYTDLTSGDESTSFNFNKLQRKKAST